MLVATAGRCTAGAKTAVVAAAGRTAAASGATRSKSAVAAAAAASDNVKNFKIYRWDPNEKVGFCAWQQVEPPMPPLPWSRHLNGMSG